MLVAPGSWRSQNSPQPDDVGTDLASQRLPPAWALTSSGDEICQVRPLGHGVVGVGLGPTVLLGVIVRVPVRVTVPVEVGVAGGVNEAVRLAVRVADAVTVDVALRVKVTVGVAVAVRVAVPVRLAV